MELSAIVALPAAVVDKPAAAFTPLAGAAPLVRAVRTMLGSPEAPMRPGVVVAAAAALVDHARESLSSLGLAEVVVVAVGGEASRADCVETALKYLAAQPVPPRRVLVHDYRRPLTSVGVRDRVIGGLRRGDAVVMPALPLTDSVKTVDSQGVIVQTLDRSTLRTVQYPRGFTVDRLSQLLTHRRTEEFDEFSEAVDNGVPVALVDGDPDGFVADLPRDAAFVEAIIACRPVDRS